MLRMVSAAKRTGLGGCPLEKWKSSRKINQQGDIDIMQRPLNVGSMVTHLDCPTLKGVKGKVVGAYRQRTRLLVKRENGVVREHCYKALSRCQKV